MNVNKIVQQDGVNRHPDVLSTDVQGLRWQSLCRGDSPNFSSNIALGVLNPTDVSEVPFIYGL